MRLARFLLFAAVQVLLAGEGAGALTPAERAAVEAKVLPALVGYDALALGRVRQGRVVLTRAYGRGNLAEAYEYASVSKPVKAATLMRLLLEGRIRSLDDNLWDDVPRFRGPCRPLTRTPP